MSNLLRTLSHKFKSSGWQVKSNTLKGYDNIPRNWKGPVPDLLITKDDGSIALCIEDAESLSRGNHVNRWRSFEANDAKLMIVVKDRHSHIIVKKDAAKENIEVVIRFVERGYKKDSSGKSSVFSTHSKVDWMIVFTIVTVLLAFVVLVFPDLMSHFKMKDFYQPFDKERQDQYIKNKEDDYKGKSVEEQKDKARDDSRQKLELEKRQKKIHGK